MSGTATEARRIFRYEGVTIAVESTDARDLVWLEECAAPAFDVTDRGLADHRIVFSADDRGYREAVQQAPASITPRELNLLALDRGPVSLPCWVAPDGSLMVHDEEYRVCYRIAPERAHTQLLVSGDARRARVALLRLVRGLALRGSEERGGLAIHGAACVVDGRGMILAGGKRAGKSSLLLHALREEAVRFIANDCVVVFPEGSGSRMRGMASIITLRSDTVDRFPDLRSRLSASPHRHWLILTETRDLGTTLQPRSDAQFTLTTAQFSRLVQREAEAGGPVRVVLFPAVTGAAGAISLRELSPAAAATRLSDALFGRGRRRPGASQEGGRARSPEETGLLRIISTVRCFECRLGLDAFDGTSSLSTLIAST